MAAGAGHQLLRSFRDAGGREGRRAAGVGVRSVADHAGAEVDVAGVVPRRRNANSVVIGSPLVIRHHVDHSIDVELEARDDGPALLRVEVADVAVVARALDMRIGDRRIAVAAVALILAAVGLGPVRTGDGAIRDGDDGAAVGAVQGRGPAAVAIDARAGGGRRAPGRSQPAEIGDVAWDGREGDDRRAGLVARARIERVALAAGECIGCAAAVDVQGVRSAQGRRSVTELAVSAAVPPSVPASVPPSLPPSEPASLPPS